MYFTPPLGVHPELQAEWESPGCPTHHLPAGARIPPSRAVDVYGPLPSSFFLERYASGSARILKRSASNSARSSPHTAFSSAVPFSVSSRLMRLLVSARGVSESPLRLGTIRSSSSRSLLHVAV